MRSDRRPPKDPPPRDEVEQHNIEGYEVGRGRPPLHTRFKPGGQGGPGRPRGSKNRETLFKEAFDTPRPVTIEGRRKRMTAHALGYHQLATRVAKGDLKAIGMAEQIRNSLCGAERTGEAVVHPLSDAELAILRRMSGE